MQLRPILQYFVDLDPDDALVPYLLANLELWDKCHLLGDVIDAGYRMTLVARQGAPNLPHGAPMVRRGNADEALILDRQEVETEHKLFNMYGPFARLTNRSGSIEIRTNLIVAHEFAHHLDQILPRDSMQSVAQSYEEACAKCHHAGESEYLVKDVDDVNARHFISAYARTKQTEFFAECVSAFTHPESREALADMHPAVHEMLTKLTAANSD